MKARLIAPVMFGVMVACLALGAYGQQAQPPRGQIKAVRVVGQVLVTRVADKTPVALQNNDALAQGDVVTTAKNASVVLVFSNGSTVNLGQESKMAIDEFLQDPFGAEIKVGELKEEPSTSRTKLNLTYGELVGSVKKLKGASSFLVQTPVGAAGIRGTIFRLVYRLTGTGQAFFTLSVTAGEVIFQGTTGAPISVGANRGIEVEVEIDPVTGAVRIIQVNRRDISPEARQVIEQEVTRAVESLLTTSLISRSGLDRLVYRATGSTFTLSTEAGEVIYRGTTNAPILAGDHAEILVTVSIDDATGTVRAVEVVSSDIPAEARQIIQQQVTEALESPALAAIIGGTRPNNPLPSQSPAPPRPPLPPPAPEPPRTTPGDGQAG